MENWKSVEKNVDEAEKKKRQEKNASKSTYFETGITKKERQEKSDDEILENAKRKRVAKKALERDKFFSQEAEQILGDADSSERALINLRKENLSKALRYDKAIGLQREKFLSEKVEILEGFDGAPTGEELEALDEIRKDLEENQNLKEAASRLTPEAYFGLHLKELKEYKKELEQGRIVETEYVKNQMEDIAVHIRANKPVLIYGHLGSGKSEIAMHTAKKITEKDPLIISGSKNISQSEFYGHQILTVDEESGATKSDFYMGPIYQAMEEGRVVIIDEVNAIPHEVLISLNNILTRKAGEKMNIQQDGGREVEIKEGFGVIMTGNLNQGEEKYIDRQDMDSAFLSRLRKIEYDYLPQVTEGSLENEAGEENELFQLLLAHAMDSHGCIEAPNDTVRKLWNLAKSARVIQDVFAGREIENAYYFQQAGGRNAKYLLKESVLSLRALDNIINQWKSEGYEKELDFYVWNNFIKESTVASDRAYLYQMLKDRFNFFQSEGWDENPDYGSGGVVNSFDIKAPKNKPAERKFFGQREVVEFAFGKAPERAQWPEISPEEVEIENEINPEIMELEEFKSELEKEMSEIWKEIEEVCEMEME